MSNFIFILIVVGIVIYLYKSRKKVVRKLEENYGRDKDDLIKGFELHVTPKVTTRLKVLNLRNRIFKTEKEAENLDFRMDEGTFLPVVTSWDELGLKEIGEEVDKQLGDFVSGETWTDIGMMYPKELERYYKFLEKFRSIIENEKIPPPERVDRVQMLKDKNGFLIRLNEKYEIDFPENIFIDRLAKIDGISTSIGKQLYDMEIYDIKGLNRLSKAELKDLNGVGDVRADKIRKTISD